LHNQPNELLLVFRRAANDDEQALHSILEPGLAMNAVGQEYTSRLLERSRLLPRKCSSD
jgi:hypothetical protein